METNNAMPLGQVSRTCTNLDASIAWYRDVLGLPFLFAAPGLAFFACGDTRLALSEHAEAGAESILYFQVEDLDSVYDELMTRGVESLRAPERVHTHVDGREEWMAFFNDPDGRALALMSVKPNPNG